MLRRRFLQAAPVALAARAFSQGREFRKNPPIAAPTSRRIIDMHVHTFFQEQKPASPQFTPQLNNSRPDGVYQMNASRRDCPALAGEVDSVR